MAPAADVDGAMAESTKVLEGEGARVRTMSEGADATAAAPAEPLHARSRIALADGSSMPTVGFGTYLIPNDDVARCVKLALEAGYDHIDTAEVYRNEAGVGDALRGVEPRPFVTTKNWPGNPQWNQAAKTYETTLASARTSNELLGAPPDLILNHAPFGGGKADRLEQWRALLDAKREGLAKSVGVSNYSIAHLEEIAAAGMEAPAANQLEIHPHGQKAELLAYMKTKHIGIIAYSSLAPIATWRDGQQSGKTDAAEDQILAAVAGRVARTQPQVLLRWALQKGYAILPKSTTDSRIVENRALFDFELDAGAMADLDGLERGVVAAFGSPEAPYDPTTAP